MKEKNPSEYTDQDRETLSLAAFIMDFVYRSPHLENWVLITFDKEGHPFVAASVEDPRAVFEELGKVRETKTELHDFENEKEGKPN